MTLDRIAFILVAIAAVIIAIVWLVGGVIMIGQDPISAWLILVPLGIISFFIIWLIVERLGNKEDDHYDRIEK